MRLESGDEGMKKKKPAIIDRFFLKIYVDRV